MNSKINDRIVLFFTFPPQKGRKKYLFVLSVSVPGHPSSAGYLSTCGNGELRNCPLNSTAFTSVLRFFSLAMKSSFLPMMKSEEHRSKNYSSETFCEIE